MPSALKEKPKPKVLGITADNSLQFDTLLYTNGEKSQISPENLKFAHSSRPQKSKLPLLGK